MSTRRKAEAMRTAVEKTTERAAQKQRMAENTTETAKGRATTGKVQHQRLEASTA
jgi:hypothetical protein